MKFTFKSVCCLVMENVAFSVPHLRKKYFQNIYSKNRKKLRNKKRNKSKQIENIWYLGHADFENFLFFEVHIDKHNIF